MKMLLVFSVAPKIKTPLKDITIKAGQILHLDIDFIGEPPPEVTWTVDSRDLKTDARTTVTSIGYHTIINTVNTKRSDSGRYHLHLRNSSGMDEGSFQVSVLGQYFHTNEHICLCSTVFIKMPVLLVTSGSKTFKRKMQTCSFKCNFNKLQKLLS